MTSVIILVLLGLIPATVARNKGRRFGLWWAYGTFLFLLALPHAWTIRPLAVAPRARRDDTDLKRCPFCGAMLESKAAVCGPCGRELSTWGASHGFPVIDSVLSLMGLGSAEVSPPRRPILEPELHARRLYNEGVDLFASGDPREGLRRFAEAISVDPKCIDAHLAIAAAFCKLDAAKHANLILPSTDAVLAVEPTNPRARNIASVTYFELGKAALDREEWHAATSAFQSSYGIDPSVAHCADALATCAENAGKLEDAIAMYEKVVATNPADTHARYLAGRSYMKLALRSKADPVGYTKEEALQRCEFHLKGVLTNQPSHAQANKWLGAAYLMGRRDIELEQVLNVLCEVDPPAADELREMRGW